MSACEILLVFQDRFPCLRIHLHLAGPRIDLGRLDILKRNLLGLQAIPRRTQPTGRYKRILGVKSAGSGLLQDLGPKA